MISVTTKNNHIENISKELSILVSLYGLSFIIRYGAEKKFFEYFLHQANPSSLEKKLLAIIEERPVLKDNFDQINIIHHNNLNTLVPKDFVDPKTNRDVLKQNVQLLAHDTIASDYIENIDAYNLYVPYKNISKIIDSEHPKITNLHSTTHFFKQINSTRKEQQKLPIYEVFVNIFPEDFQIAAFKNEQLLAYNHFKYQNTDDFLYFLFFIFETLEIKEEQSQIFLFGTEKSNDIIENLKDFTYNLKILPPKNTSQIYNFF